MLLYAVMLLCCIVHVIELSYVFKIGKMKVDNLVVLALLYSLILDLSSQWQVRICLQLVLKCNFNMWVYHTKCIKRVGGFPNKIMVPVATLGIDVAPYLFLL